MVAGLGFEPRKSSALAPGAAQTFCSSHPSASRAPGENEKARWANHAGLEIEAGFEPAWSICSGSLASYCVYRFHQSLNLNCNKTMRISQYSRRSYPSRVCRARLTAGGLSIDGG